jgi:hypothetical protein
MPKNNDNGNVLFGCGLVLLLGFLLLAGGLISAVNRERQAVYYPGSVPMANHANYRGLPTQLRWDNAYLTTDPFNDVYSWYSIKFALGAEVRAIDRCITLEGPIEHLFLDQEINVVICATPNGQMIFVSRWVAIPDL